MPDKLILLRIFIKFALVIGTVIMIFGLLFIFVKPVENKSSSMAIGRYMAFPVFKPELGNTYTICLSPDKKKYLNTMSKLGLEAGDCANGYISLLKQIVAVPGDIIEITMRGVLVNHQLIANSQSSTTYNNINLLPLKIGYIHKLVNNEYFVMGIDPQSYDSRYFGMISQSEITARAIFLR